MTDRPIIFSAAMVRALLDGRKTQTRRLVKNVPDQPAPDCHPSHTPRHAAPYLDAYCGEKRTLMNPRGQGHNWHWWQVDDRPGPVAFRLPYAPGDRLYVREAWNQSGLGFGNPRRGFGRMHYRADPDHGWQDYWGRWRPSIHMPRWASRLTLTVTEVRVQRLQDISEADAMAEGAEYAANNLGFSPISGQPHGVRSFKAGFAHLWNSLHGPDAWDANPWVAAINFRVRKGNIDAQEAL